MKKVVIQGLVVLSGPPGCGKSTFTEKLPKGVALSSDSIRSMLYGNKEFGSSYCPRDTDDKAVFDLLKQAVEARLKHRLPTVVDTTAINDDVRAQWYTLAAKYQIPFKVLIFDTSLDDCIQNDAHRSKHVGEEVVKKFHDKFQQTSKYAYSIISTDTFPVCAENIIDYPLENLYACGDIHGAYDQFLELYNAHIQNTDNKLIILGDFLDRGSKSIEMLDWMMEHQKEHFILMGNHEYNVLQLLEGNFNIPAGSSSRKTANLILRQGVPYTKKVINFLTSLPDHYCYYVAPNNRYVFVHADISEFDLYNQPPSIRIKGISKLNKQFDTDAAWDYWTVNSCPRSILIRGHIGNTNDNAQYVISLDKEAGFGGNVCFMKLSTFDRYLSSPTENYNAMKELSFLEELKKVPKKYYHTETVEGLTVAKYSKKAFLEAPDYPILQKARGVVLDVFGSPIGEVFHKIPNYREGDSVKQVEDYLASGRKLYPVEKANGFLVNIFKHPYKQELVLATSGSLTGEHVQLAKEMIAPHVYQQLLNFLTEHGYKSIQLECISPKDPHLVDYEGFSGFFVLGIDGLNMHSYSNEIVNQLDLPDFRTVLKYKETDNIKELTDFAQDITLSRNFEGFILYDDQGRGICKLKTYWYLLSKYFSRMALKNIVRMFLETDVYIEELLKRFNTVYTLHIVQNIVNCYTMEQWKSKTDQERLAVIKELLS